MAALFLTFAVLLSPQLVTSTPPLPRGFSLPLINRDSIYSPFYLSNLTATRMIHGSAARMHRFNASALGDPEVAMGSPVSYDDWKYMVSVGIGTPPTNQLMLLDTGSDIVWVQCHPCVSCFRQDPPLFRPSNSRTFRLLPCHHPLCDPGTCVNGVCRFFTRYMSGPSTKGSLATDHFTFRSRNGGAETTGDIVLGCSTESSGNMFGPTTTKIAGVLGLGSGPQSLASQLGDRIQRRFSYCLLPGNQQGFSYLRFGSDIVIGQNSQSTPLILASKNRYYLILMDISINNRHLDLPRGTFVRHPDETGGCHIDSGSSVTYLIRSAYDSVKNVLMNYFRRYSLTKISDSEFDLCYFMPYQFEAFPSMTFHFEGANLLLRTQNLFLINNARSSFCLTIKPDDHYTAFGAAQQTNIQFIYDIGNRRLTFAPMDCTRS